MFIWAFFVAFSRIMVGVHYPGDILSGALLGTVFGWLIFKILEEVYFRVKLAPLIKN
jgi:undecaprenyl-diphosphatase